MIIAIASGKGGTGKTFLSTNLFRTMEKSGLDVRLADCDAEVPNSSLFLSENPLQQWKTQMLCPEIDRDKCIYCGACAAYCSFHAITCVSAAKFIVLSRELCHGCGACFHACRQGALRPSSREVGTVTSFGTPNRVPLYEGRIREGQKTSVPVIRDVIRHATEEAAPRYLILDAPPGCSCPFVNTVMPADLVILVSEPTPFGLSDLKNTVAVLRKMHKNFCVVINRADLGDGAMKAYLEAEDIGILAEIPYARSIAEHYAQGDMVVETMPEMSALFKNLMYKIQSYEDSGRQR